MKINEDNLNTKKKTITYQNDNTKINIYGGQREQQSSETKFL